MTRQGQILAGRYKLGPLLVAGGMASVYRATDRMLARTVAVKVPSKAAPPVGQTPTPTGGEPLTGGPPKSPAHLL
jgi:hypothetical protein